MKVCVIGANGQIGQHLVRKLNTSNSHEVIAMVRKKEQIEKLNQQNIHARLIDLEASVETIADAIEGVDAVVFTAGSGGSTGADKTILVDLDGAIKSVEAAKLVGVPRFVLVSAIGIQNYHKEKHLDWIDRSSYYSAAKYYADKWLENTDLDYTIIRPGGLINIPETGKVKIAKELKYEKIPREDVANVIIRSLDNKNTYKKSFDVTSGDSSIDEALNSI